MKQFTLIAAMCAVMILGPGVVRADSIQESSLEFNARALFEHASLSDDAGKSGLVRLDHVV